VIICEIIVHLLVIVQNKKTFLNNSYIYAVKDYLQLCPEAHG